MNETLLVDFESALKSADFMVCFRHAHGQWIAVLVPGDTHTSDEARRLRSTSLTELFSQVSGFLKEHS
jgi:hypothetical protein